MERHAPRAQEAFGLAVGVAETLNRGYVGTERLLIGLLQKGAGATAKVLEENGVGGNRIVKLVSQPIAPDPTVQTADRTTYTPRARRVIENSYKGTARFKAVQTGTEHILVAMPRKRGCVTGCLLNIVGVSIQKLRIDLLAVIGEDTPTAKDDLRGTRVGKRDNTTPTLDSYSRNLIQLAIAGKLDPTIGRKQEIQRVVQMLSHRTKNDPCLIGRPGVGKTAVVRRPAQMIVPGDVPETIAGKKVVTLDLFGMAARSKYRGEFEERIKEVISEVVESGDVLLSIDEIHTIIGAGGAGGTPGASNILRPSPAKDKIRPIGAATINGYREYIEKDSALERRFQPVTVDRPTENESVAILKGLRNRYEEHHKTEMTNHVPETAVKLSSRCTNDRFLPNKVIDLIDETASKVRLQNYTKPVKTRDYEAEIDDLEKTRKEVIKGEAYEKAGEIKKKQKKIWEKIAQTVEKWQKDRKSKKLIVSGNETADMVSGQTRILVRKLAREESERLGNLEGILHQRVVGQEEAIAAISKTIRRGRMGLKDSERPIGSFLFLGPTGAGRTELSKALSEAMFGTENALIHMDMPEYMGKHNASKIAGPPPGYMGYDGGGQLSEKVRRNLYCVILFDEIEKAYPDVLNILLQVLDDGHTTDAQGCKIDFKSTIAIMTSNTGAENIISPERLGFGVVSDARAGYNSMKDRIMDEVKRLFKPEFLNHIGEIIVFHQSTGEHIRGIADIMLDIINKRCGEQLGIGLEVTDGTREHLIDRGYSDKYGARPLRCIIQNLVENRIAGETLDGRTKAGSLVEVGFNGGKLTSSMKAKTARPRAAAKPANKPAVKPVSAGGGSEDKSKAAGSKSRTGRASGKEKKISAPKA